MDQFTPKDAYDWIGLALAVGAILIIARHLIKLYWKTSRPAYDPLRDGPEEVAVQDLTPEQQEYIANLNRLIANHPKERNFWLLQPGIQNNPNYQPNGIQNSVEAQRMNARYAGATETEGGHHD